MSDETLIMGGCSECGAECDRVCQLVASAPIMHADAHDELCAAGAHKEECEATPIMRAVREASVWEGKPSLTDAEIEQSAATTCADHTESPSGYMQASPWADEMLKTHKQLLCGECLRWKIWVPKEPIMRGRRPGKIERVTCPVCGKDCARRASGQPFSHRVMASNGYTRLGYCKGGERT